jgi:hypothetical protein
MRRYGEFIFRASIEVFFWILIAVALASVLHLMAGKVEAARSIENRGAKNGKR